MRYEQRCSVSNMASTTETLKVTEGSEIDALLKNADEKPILLEKDGVVYRLSRVDDERPQVDPDRVERILNEVAGSWADLDTDAMIAQIYEARERGSRPIDRPRPFDFK
jgi:hypothetical protein